MAQPLGTPVSVLSKQGSMISGSFSNPMASPYARKEKEEFIVVALGIMDKDMYQVALWSVHQQKFLSPRKSLPTEGAGLHLLEYRRTLGEKQKFVAEVDAMGYISFRSTWGTYITMLGADYTIGKGWVFHRAREGNEHLFANQCKFVITKQEWLAAKGYKGGLDGRKEVIEWAVKNPLKLAVVVFSLGVMGAAMFDGLFEGASTGDGHAAGGEAPADAGDGAAPADAGDGAAPDAAQGPEHDAGGGAQEAGSGPSFKVVTQMVAGVGTMLACLTPAYQPSAVDEQVIRHLAFLGGDALRQLLATGHV